jgi:hypothetical protein
MGLPFYSLRAPDGFSTAPASHANTEPVLAVPMVDECGIAVNAARRAIAAAHLSG